MDRAASSEYWNEWRRRVAYLRGESLGNLIAELAEAAGRTHADLADAAGISESTVGQIVGGSISCPPRGRLEAFARLLDVPVSRLISAAESDGCDYGDG